jgi:AcrR family transcriptional regulator
VSRQTRAQSKQQTRAELLDAAAVVFARKGFAATSVNDVAEQAGRTTGAIYAHFASKADLFLALLDARQQRRGEVAKGIAADGRGIIERFAASFDDQRDEPGDWDLLQVEFWLYCVRDADLAPQQLARARAAIDGLGAILASLYERDGTSPPMPPRELAAVMLAMRDGLAMQRRTDPALPVGELFAKALHQLVRSAS